MNYFRKNKTISIIVGLLLIINITALITIFVQRHDIGRHKPLSKKDDIERTAFFLKEELQFTDKQVNEFLELQEEFLTQNEQYRESIMNAKSELYGSLRNNEIETPYKEKLLAKIAENTSAIEINTYDYFKKLKDLCTEDQLDKFDMLMGQILRKIDPGHRPPHEKGNRQPGERPPHPEGKPGEGHMPPPPKRK